jgi:superfamily II DNA or RNA helicase
MATFNGMSKNGAHEADMVFATWQTMNGNLKLWKRNHFDLIIVDEAHHTEASTYRPVVDYFVGARLGITATPDRADEADIREVFGSEVVNITLEEAIARGWLPRVEYHVVTDESLDEDALQKIAMEIREGKKRFTMAEVNRRIFIRKRDKEIARIIDGYNEKSVVFCANIKHAERMASSLKLSATFHSEVAATSKATWDQNQESLKALKNGTIRRVCAVNAFNEGVNVPSVGLVAFCRVTGSLTIFRQQLGRGLRPGKDKLIVLDFVGNLERIQLVLQMMNKISDLHESYTDKRERDREGYQRGNFEVSGRGFEFTFSDRVVDLMKVLEHCEAEFYPTWQEASDAAKGLGVTRDKQYYQSGYLMDPRLPSNPRQKYSDFPGWGVFLGTNHYSTWQEASQVAIDLNINFPEEYRRRYKEDKRLPSSPNKQYAGFPGWTVFLGRKPKKFYLTWQEAAEAVRRLGIRTQQEYYQRYKEDSKLNSCPHRFYKDFPGFLKFFGKD